MKNRVLVLLIVLTLSVASGVGLTSAQEGTVLKAVVDGTTNLYAEPSESAEVVLELANATVVTVLSTNESGEWLRVEVPGGQGYIMASSAVVLDLPLLAPKAFVNSVQEATALFAAPNLTSEYVSDLPNGTVATVLGVMGEFAYVDTPKGLGWSVAAGWEFLPEDAVPVLADLTSQQPELPVFAEMNVNGEIIATVPDGELVYQLGPAEDLFAEVLLSDGSTGYVIAASVSPLPNVYIEPDLVSGRGVPALFAEADMSADVLVTLDAETALVYVGVVDDYWLEVYHPAYGFAYVLSVNFGTPYTVGTVGLNDAVVRAGPNDNLYDAVAILKAGTPVIVKGLSESGAWVEVAIPFGEVDFGYNGVAGWARDFLFVDMYGASTLDTDLLGVTE